MTWWSMLGVLGVAAGEGSLFRRTALRSLAIWSYSYVGHVAIAAAGVACWLGVVGHRALPARPWSWAWLPALVIVDDLAWYAVHRWLHSLAWTWRTHRLHHSAERLDALVVFWASPLDVFAGAFLPWVALAWIGVPATMLTAVRGASCLVQATTHARFQWAHPPWWSYVFVTSASHAVHHSADPKHAGVNFGGVLSVWDRWFGTHYEPGGHVLRFGL